MAIRLCKNVKADAAEDGKQIALPSFDIAATMYHADLAALTVGAGYELAVLAETQRHLDRLARDHEHARSLIVPDGSRRVLDTVEKHRALISLSLEVDELARQVAAEQTSTRRGSEANSNTVEDALRKSYVPI